MPKVSLEQKGVKLPLRCWEQLEGEPDSWYSRFLVFANIHTSERTLENAFTKVAINQKERYTIETWRNQCAKWYWLSRAERRDAMMQKKIHESAVKRIQARQEDWENVMAELTNCVREVVEAKTEEELAQKKLAATKIGMLLNRKSVVGEFLVDSYKAIYGEKKITEDKSAPQVNTLVIEFGDEQEK